EGGVLFFEVRAPHDDGGGRVDVVYPGAVDYRGEELGGGGVVHAGVDVVRADDRAHELGERVGVLVGAPGPAEPGDGPSAVLPQDPAETVGDDVQRFHPGSFTQLAVASPHERRRQTLRRVHELVAEAALVRQPALVGVRVVDAEEPQHLVLGDLDADRVAGRAVGAGRGDLSQVPRPGPEAVRCAEQGAHRADLDGVAGEVGPE